MATSKGRIEREDVELLNLLAEPFGPTRDDHRHEKGIRDVEGDATPERPLSAKRAGR